MTYLRRWRGALLMIAVVLGMSAACAICIWWEASNG